MTQTRRWRRVRSVLAMVRLQRDARGPLALVTGLTLLAVIADLVTLFLVYRAAAGLLEGTATVSSLQQLALLAVVTVIARQLMFTLAEGIAHIAAYRVQYHLRLRMADRLARIPLGYFTRHRSGEVKNLMVDHVDQLETFLAHGMPEMVAGLGAWLLTMVWLLAVDWRLAMAAAAVVPVAFLMMHLGIRRAEHHIPACHAAEARMTASIVEFIVAIPVIKVFNRCGDAFREASESIADCGRAWTRWTRDFLPAGTAFYTVIVSNIVVILPAGLWLHLTGRVTVTTLLFFFIIGIGSSIPLLTFFQQGVHLSSMATSCGLVDVLLSEPELPDSGRRVRLTDHSVEFRQVSFAYTSPQVLNDVSFTAPQGQVTALVGPSGAGKTTIARLIARFWDADEGAVLLGGVDVRDIAVAQLVAEVAFVFQDTFLFDDTIEANLRIGRADASAAQVEAAARLAGCHDFIVTLPDGYQTRVGGRGVRLSGGERQRITIARAILKDAPVVVLDEATAFADPEREVEIQDAISALVAGRTLVVVAHRLSTVAGADQIVVVAEGRVVDRGRHETLLARCGLYRRMWEEQPEATHRGVPTASS